MRTSGVNGGRTRGKAAPAAAFSVVGTAVALSLLGGVAAVQAVASSSTTPTHRVAPAAVGQDVPTSFGVVAVQYVERVAALPAHALAGSGQLGGTIPGAGETELSVAVAVTNVRDRTVDYGPGQFRLRLAQGGQALSPSGSTFPAGTLQPHAGIEGRVSFIVPRGRSAAAVEFLDRTRPIVIGLGRVAQFSPHVLGRGHH